MSFSMFLIHCYGFTFLVINYVTPLLQGFRKVDPDRWEFANEGFLRGQKHLLKTISRKKPPHGQNRPHTQQSQNPNSACVEVGKFGLEEEVERLKRDKNVLMQELVRLRQQQQSTDNQLQTMVNRLHGMEQRQQQMMSFLAKVVQSPGFLAQFVQQQAESKRITGGNKKRRTKPEHISKNEASSSDGQIVKYQSYANGTTKAMLRQLWDIDGSSQSDSFNNKPDSFPVDGILSPNMPNKENSAIPISGAVLQGASEISEKPVALGAPECKANIGGGKDQPTPAGSVSEVTTNQPSKTLGSLFGTQDITQVSHPQSDVIMDEFPPFLDMAPESIMDITYDELLLDPPSIEADGAFPPLDIDSISIVDSFFNEDEELWDMLNEKSEGTDAASDCATTVNKNNSQPAEAERMDSLTEQTGLFSSDPKTTI